MNIALACIDDNLTRVTTETRIACADRTSRMLFRVYWTLISPFSGLIRREWLRIIKKVSEDVPAQGHSFG